MNSTITKRKSVRKYREEKLSNEVVDRINQQIKTILPLYDNITVDIEIVESVKGPFYVSAPYYLTFYSEIKDGYLENIGFIGQKLSLFLTENGIGSCWLGMAKPKSKGTLPFIICMAFGLPDEQLFRELKDFNRKPLSEISRGEDQRLESARLAPSGMNLQNWYFIVDNSRIDCYTKKKVVSGKMGLIDLGIALSHIAIESTDFSFSRIESYSEIKNYSYVGSVL